MQAKAALFEMLREYGTRYVFGNPGTTELNFIEMFADYPDITYILGLHDAVPVGMAYGYALATGQPAFLNLHITPGLANGLANIFNAHRAKVPLVVTAGQIDRRMMLQEPTLWSDLARLASQFTKWAYEAKTGQDIPDMLARAVTIASTPPAGPVFLSLPMDCLDEEIAGTASRVELTRRLRPTGDVIDRIARQLAAASNPTLIVGAGAASPEARAALVTIAELTGARVFGERLPVRSVFPTDHPQYLGMIGFSHAQLQSELSGADVVVLAGVRRFAALLYMPVAKLAHGAVAIQVDDDPWEIGKNFPATLGVVGDPAVVFPEVAERLAGLLDAPTKQRAAERMARVRGDRERRVEAWLQDAPQPEAGQQMRPEYVYRILARFMTDRTTIVDEALLQARFIDRYLPLHTERSYLGVAAGALGLGLPASLGAQLAWPDRHVICVIGDGSLMYAGQALWTAARYHIPVTVLVLNNRAYQILKDGMRAYKRGAVAPERMVGMDLNDPAIDICGMARALGVPGQVVEDPTQLREALSDATGAPRLFDVLVQP